jgi:autotransporter translocation and assembly factor TamB
LSAKKILKGITRWVLYIIGILLFLVIAICLLLQTPWGQRTLKDKAVAYLQNKLHTKVSIGQLKTNWLYNIQLRQVYLEDPQKKGSFVCRVT